MQTKNQIAIDGPAASGKSVVGKLLSKKLDYLFLDTGLMYRAATKIITESDILFSDLKNIKQLIKKASFELNSISHEPRLLVNSKDLTDSLKTSQIDKDVSTVSKIPEVREILVSHQRKIAKHTNIVMVGRDIGSIVLPNATLKIYLDASVEVRTNRRLNDSQQNFPHNDFDIIKRDLIQRDNSDSNREHSPLIIPKGSVVIDTSDLKITEVIDSILKELENL